MIVTAYEAFDLGYNIRLIGDLTGSTAGKIKHEAGIRMINGLIPKPDRVPLRKRSALASPEGLLGIGEGVKAYYTLNA